MSTLARNTSRKSLDTMVRNASRDSLDNKMSTLVRNHSHQSLVRSNSGMQAADWDGLLASPREGENLLSRTDLVFLPLPPPALLRTERCIASHALRSCGSRALSERHTPPHAHPPEERNRQPEARGARIDARRLNRTCRCA